MSQASATETASAPRLDRHALVWDMVLPYEPDLGNSAAILHRWAGAGFDFVSLHPAGDRHNAGEALHRIASARKEILGAPDRFVLVETADDVLRAKAQTKLAVGLHIEGSRLLERNIDLIEVYYKLGIRFCHPVFNLVNSFGGGCADRVDVGLTLFGIRVVEEMNRIGMLLDGAHVGYRTTMEMMERSTAPVIFSHNGCSAVHAHFRNVRDDQIRSCAATGGVVGITGMNNYLGDEPTNETLLRHIEHVAGLVGPEHVGLGLDYVQDADALDAFVRARPDEWGTSWKPFRFARPEQIPALAELLLAHGYPECSVRGIMGENFFRVCRETWQ